MAVSPRHFFQTTQLDWVGSIVIYMALPVANFQSIDPDVKRRVNSLKAYKQLAPCISIRDTHLSVVL